MRAFFSTLLISATLISEVFCEQTRDVKRESSPTLHLDADADHLSIIRPQHFRPLLAQYLQSVWNASSAAPPLVATDILHTLGVDELEAISFSNKLQGDTWINRAFLQNQGNNTGVFELLDHSDPSLDSPFHAPISTDIAAQFSIDLRQASALITSLAHDYHWEKEAAAWLDQPLAQGSIREQMANTQARVHLSIDFDDNDQINLGRVHIGRPHFLLRMDGANQLLESYLTHLIKYRGVPFMREEKGPIISYRLPNFLKAATANILPFIQFDTESNTATLASTQEFFTLSQNKALNISEDKHFQATWKGIPAKGSAMLYISKRVLNSSEKLYNRAVEEQWTDNPAFLKNRHLYDQFVKDLNSSQTGIAFSISEKPTGQLISLKGPFPSALFALIFGAGN